MAGYRETGDRSCLPTACWEGPGLRNAESGPGKDRLRAGLGQPDKAVVLEGQGADEALFLDVDGHCSEASASNLFVWTGETLVTPPVSCGALPGITRATVLEIATAMGLEALERPCTLDEVLASEEAFLTSSLRGIAPLVRIDGHAIGPGRPGPVTRRVSTAHQQLLERATSGL